MKYYLLILLLAGYACKQPSSNSSSKEPELESAHFSITSSELNDNRVRVVLQNTSTATVNILGPMEKKIMVLADEDWKNVGVLYCDCGGPPCPAPRESMEVPPGEAFTFTWDLMEEECVNNQTTRNKIGEGTYKAIYRYRLMDGSTREVLKLEIPFSVGS